jgi:flagellin-like hook-associated protein FlgL
VSEARENLLSGTMDWSGSWGNASAWHADGTHGGFAVMSRKDSWSGLYKAVKLVAGHTYTFSACVRVEPGESHFADIYASGGGTVNDTLLANSEFDNPYRRFNNVADGEWHIISHTFTVKTSKYAKPRVEGIGGYGLSVCAYMLVEGDTPAAWAPAEGETLAGGGALMSANLLAEGDRRDGADGTTYADGVWSIPANGTSKDKNAANDWPTGTEAVTENQTFHVGLSVRAASGASVVVAPGVAYVDGAGNVNYVATRVSAMGTGAWQRVEGSFVMPSGMRVSFLFIHQGAGGAALELTAPTLSYGSPVTLASSAHTPYATQDHIAATYATRASLKVTSDAVTAEVEERGKLAGKVGTLESTSGTHASKLEQLASSIRSLVKGESTYTDPDGKSATSGIYSLVTQTRDAVTAIFGQYTKTADLASTQAVRDARKAGTDAQAAAATAQTAADSAKSTADSAKSAADRAQSTADAALDNAGTANGKVRAVEARFSASIDGLDVRVRGVSEAVSAQGATVRDVEKNMSFGLDGLVIGAADSASKVRITEKRETFEVDGKTVLALDGDTSTVEASALKIGGYVWTATNGGKNLTLVYRG